MKKFESFISSMKSSQSHYELQNSQNLIGSMKNSGSLISFMKNSQNSAVDLL